MRKRFQQEHPAIHSKFFVLSILWKSATLIFFFSCPSWINDEDENFVIKSICEGNITSIKATLKIYDIIICQERKELQVLTNGEIQNTSPLECQKYPSLLRSQQRQWINAPAVTSNCPTTPTN